MPLADDIGEFRRNIARAVEELEEAKLISDKLTEYTVDEMYPKLTQLQDLCEQASIEIRRASDRLVEINSRWGSKPFKSYSIQSSQQPLADLRSSYFQLRDFDILEINLKTCEDGNFFKLSQLVLQAQNEYSTFSNLNQAKGILGEILCPILLHQLFPSIDFLQGQVGTSVDISSEEQAYKVAQEFFAQHPASKLTVAERHFGGGQPYSLDVVNMLISKYDVENWSRNKQSTATYFVFESKTNAARLSELQKQFSYVKRQALYMFRNRNKIEDRSQLGQDLLKALEENRVVYIASHIDLQTGDLTARFIR